MLAILWAAGGIACAAGERTLDPRMHHLRSGPQREWSEFPVEAEGPELRLTFTADANATPYVLRLRHRDVKQTWRLRLNDREIGRLPPDESPMITWWDLPPGTLKFGENALVVSGSGTISDDVMLGDIRLVDLPRTAALNESSASVQVVDAETGKPIPARVTIVDDQDSLATVGLESTSRLAVRPGVVYTSDGRAEFGLPSGTYTFYAGRGFEYGIDSSRIELRPGQHQDVRLAIRREVPLRGYFSCDTHVHTFTYSRHGDATLEERLVTIAGEGLELPIATDHNLQIDYESPARAAGLRSYFTPVVGNEVTTRVGHFNVFPLDPSAPVIDYRGSNWSEIFAAIGHSAQTRIVVLNHPRDVHSGFRPFDPRRHISLTGEDLDGWKLEANAIELVNSGALQTDPWRLVHDWLGLLNAGMRIAPVGASDSHDVCRSILAQARTYVRCRDEDPGKIDVREAVKNLAAGKVLMSFGLVADVMVDGPYGPGDLVPAKDKSELEIKASVLGPSWSSASEVVLFVNGVEARREPIPAEAGRRGGVKYETTWKLPRPRHDAYLTVVALGPGVSGLYWPTPKPYQPDSPDWKPYSLGATGAVWIDADGEKGFTSARDYAVRLADQSQGDIERLTDLLRNYDEAIAAHVARELMSRRALFTGSNLETLLARGAPQTRAGVNRYIEAWKKSEAARAEP